LPQASTIVLTFIKYCLSMADMAMEGRWEGKGVAGAPACASATCACAGAVVLVAACRTLGQLPVTNSSCCLLRASRLDVSLFQCMFVYHVIFILYACCSCLPCAVFYLELTLDMLHLLVYCAFFAVVFSTYGIPLHLVSTGIRILACHTRFGLWGGTQL
jgi:hypothetical protein